MHPHRMQGTLARTRRPKFHAGAALALGLLVGVPLLATANAAPGQEWVEGVLEFPQPARLEAGLALPDEWIVQWISTPETGLVGFQVFSVAGAVAESEYEETLLGPGLLNIELGRPPAASPLVKRTLHDIYHEFSVELVPRSGLREIVLRGDADPDGRLLAAGGWTLSTAGPAAQLLEQSPSGGMKRANGWNVMLESSDVDVDTAAVREIYVYGYDVTIHHRDGEDDHYTTGMSRIDEGTPLRAVSLHEDLDGAFVHRDARLLLRPSGTRTQTAAPGMNARVLAPSLPVAGTIEFVQPTGTLATSQGVLDVSGDRFALSGSFVLTAREPDPQPASVASHKVDVAGMAEGLVLVPASAATLAPAPRAGPLVAAALAAGLLVLLAAWWRGWLWSVPAGLYTRLTKQDVDHSPIRRRLLDVIVQEPGLGVQDLARKAGCGWGTVTYHVAMLEKLGYVQSRRIGLRRCLFENHGRYPRPEREAWGLVRQPSTQALLRALDAAAGITQVQLAARTGLSQPQVSRLLAQARRAGLVDGDARAGPGPALTDLGRALLVQVETTTQAPGASPLPDPTASTAAQ